MDEILLKVKRFSKKAKLITKKEGDAGFDIYAIFENEIVILNVGEIIILNTGFGLEFPKDYFFSIRERTSTGKIGISVKGGVVDSSYRGEIKLILNNTSDKPIVFLKDEKMISKYKENISEYDFSFYPQTKAVAQGVLIKISNPKVLEVEELTETERGDKMFGSSNK